MSRLHFNKHFLCNSVCAAPVVNRLSSRRARPHAPTRRRRYITHGIQDKGVGCPTPFINDYSRTAVMTTCYTSHVCARGLSKRHTHKRSLINRAPEIRGNTHTASPLHAPQSHASLQSTVVSIVLLPTNPFAATLLHLHDLQVFFDTLNPLFSWSSCRPTDYGFPLCDSCFLLKINMY